MHPMQPPPMDSPPPTPPHPPTPWIPAPATTVRRPPSTKKKVLVALGIFVTLLIIAAGFALWFNSWSTSRAQQHVPADAWLGECFADDGSKEAVSCDELHHYEVIDSVYWDEPFDYPSSWDQGAGIELCEESFEAYTGDSYWSSEYEYATVFPDRETWEGGEQIAVCALYHPAGSGFTSPVGSWD